MRSWAIILALFLGVILMAETLKDRPAYRIPFLNAGELAPLQRQF
jgi:hypothetical protein